MSGDDNQTDAHERLQREAWKWVLHMTSGDASKADVAALERWCASSSLHAEAFARASGKWQAFGPALQRLAEEQAGAPKVRSAGVGGFASRRAVLFGGAALAASAAGVSFVLLRPPLDLWPSFTELTADYRTAAGERRHIALADNLSLEMNTRTSVNIDKSADAAARIELISGEAVIAAQSRAIEVRAAAGRAFAENAQFNVRLDGSNVCVTCLDGIVHVEQRGKSIGLQSKQQVSYGEREFGQMTQVDPTEVVGWRQGDLFFRDAPLARVIEEINRYRPGKIVLMNQDLGRRRVTAHFKIERLDVIIAQLRGTFSAHVTTLPGGIVFVS